MTNRTNNNLGISPAKALGEIANAIPPECRDNLIIIGSLAVGYNYFRQDEEMAVRTKDADALIAPRVEAVEAGIAITEKLIENNWQFRPDNERTKPGNASTPDRELPAVRLKPNENSEWFLELLTEPASSTHRKQQWTRLETRYGHFGLPSFGFLSLATFKPIRTDLGIHIARPEMMALANLLEHPEIGDQIMSGGFAGRPDINRANKDLGRVIAIARLAIAQDERGLDAWSVLWKEALQNCFAEDWQGLASGVGQGLKELLESNDDLGQAHFTCVNGLLASKPPTLDVFRITGERLLVLAVEPLETMGNLGE